MIMKNKLFLLGLLPLAIALAVPSTKAFEANAYTKITSLPTTIYLADTTESDIRSYYSSLDSMSESERTGNNLLKNLKTILKNGQKYYAYDTSAVIWQMYEIVDRDWAKSPAKDTTNGTYDASTHTITNYKYGSNSNNQENPYLHSLYVNRNVENKTRAWGDHGQTQWGINREHIWPKSQGFNYESTNGGARGDPMHLWSGNGRVNGTEHNDEFYGYVDTSKSYVTPSYENLSGNLRGTSRTLGSGTVFEPQNSDKGDIARACFYMVARYNYLANDGDTIDADNPNLEFVESATNSSSYTSSVAKTGKMGILSDLLEWNRIDPPDDFEIHRNNLLYTNFTNNRNPFIDFPDWAEYIWGNKKNVGHASPKTDSLRQPVNPVDGDVTPSGGGDTSSDTSEDTPSEGGDSAKSKWLTMPLILVPIAGGVVLLILLIVIFASLSKKNRKKVTKKVTKAIKKSSKKKR